jgi:ubiquinone/menaquinone biosynthesis C-methylase UbiE
MTDTVDTSDVRAHFAERAAHYDRSSNWCTDDALAQAIVQHTAAGPAHRVLDVACGTGLVSRLFKGNVAEIVGVDITREMYAQAAPRLDRFVEGAGEALPFDDASFDRVTCRQGTQFMDDAAAIREMARVLKPGGRAVIVNLCAYGDSDQEEYFEVLRLRNPARRNFYRREDLSRLMAAAGLSATVHDFVIDEDVDAWSDNKAISEDRREGIRRVYREASPAFAELHGVRIGDGRILDRMLFGIAVGEKV